MARKKSVAEITKRPRDLRRYRRDQERFKFWQTKAGNWRGQAVDESAPSFAWRKPEGRYLGRDGKWRETPKKGGKVRLAPAPALFTPKKRTNKAQDLRGLQEFQKLLLVWTSAIWQLRILPSVANRIGNPIVKPGSSKQTGRKRNIQGFRTVGQYVSSKPWTTDWFQLQDVMRAAGENEILAKIFGSRRTALHVKYLDIGGTRESDGKWTSPVLANSWNTTISQAEPRFQELASKYVVVEGDDKGKPESSILEIRLLIE